jgi:hypothetical protein
MIEVSSSNLSRCPALLYSPRSIAYCPIAVAHRGVELALVEITPNGIFRIVKGEPGGMSILTPIAIVESSDRIKQRY